MIILMQKIELAIKCEANTNHKHYNSLALLWSSSGDFLKSWNVFLCLSVEN